MHNPFLQGRVSGDEMRIHIENERQSAFESRIVESVYKRAGVSVPELRTLLKKVNAGTAVRVYTADWFNSFAAFPVKLGMRRFVAQRTFFQTIRDSRSRVKFEASPECVVLDDLEAAYPGEPVCLVTRYADWPEDVAIHRLYSRPDEGEFMVLRRFGEVVTSFERFHAFLGQYPGWNPRESLEGY